jgi:hypothetical protein
MGCAGAALLLLVALVLGGHLVLEKGVRMVVARAAVRLGEVLPGDLPQGQRRELRDRLEDWVRGLPRGPRGERRAGRFLELAEQVLADGRMDHAELERLRAFLEEEPVP